MLFFEHLVTNPSVRPSLFQDHRSRFWVYSVSHWKSDKMKYCILKPVSTQKTLCLSHNATHKGNGGAAHSSKTFLTNYEWWWNISRNTSENKKITYFVAFWLMLQRKYCIILDFLYANCKDRYYILYTALCNWDTYETDLVTWAKKNASLYIWGQIS